VALQIAPDVLHFAQYNNKNRHTAFARAVRKLEDTQKSSTKGRPNATLSTHSYRFRTHANRI
jgi:hypothetical protein